MQTLEIQPGETKILQLGGSGRPVIGRLNVPQELTDKNMSPRFGELRRVAPQYIQPADYDSLTAEQRKQRRADFEQSEAYRAYASQPNTFAIAVQPDGRFRADDVTAGDYVFNVNFQTPTPGQPNNYRYYASATCDVHLPDMPGGSAAEPLDLGTIAMNLHHYVESGEICRRNSRPEPLTAKRSSSPTCAENSCYWISGPPGGALRGRVQRHREAAT